MTALTYGAITLCALLSVLILVLGWRRKNTDHRSLRERIDHR